MSGMNGRLPTVAEMVATRANNLNALRLAAAICVVIAHVYLLKLGTQADEPLAGIMHYSLGEHALNAFFFISGLTIAASLVRASSLLDFALARVLRIWPALMVVTLLLALAVGPAFSQLTTANYFSAPDWKSFILRGFALSASALDLPGLFVGNPHLPVVNGPPWTLKYEVICYGFLTLLSLVAGGRKHLLRSYLPIATCLVAFLYLLLIPDGDHATLPDHLARLWFAFGLGVLSWQHGRHLRPSWPLLFMGIFCTWLSIGTSLERPVSICAVAIMVLSLASLPAGWLRTFTNRTDLSYGIYITAWPITQLLVERIPGLAPIPLTILVLVMAAVCAAASWTFIEKPMINLRPRLMQRLNRLLGSAGVDPSFDLAATRSAGPSNMTQSDRLDASASPFPLLDMTSLREMAQTSSVQNGEKPAVLALSSWVRDYLMSSNPDLGRIGDVCPFTGQASRLDTIRLGSSDAGEGDVDRIEAEVLDCFRQFEAIPCKKSQAQFRTVLVSFPNCNSEAGVKTLETVHARLKFYSIFRARMLGLFHSRTEAPGLWNPDFRPLRSPVPVLAIRQLVVQDAPFVVRHPLLLPIYLRKFPFAGLRNLAAEANKRLGSVFAH